MQLTGPEMVTIRSALRATGEHELAGRFEQAAKRGDREVMPPEVHGWVIEDGHLVYKGGHGPVATLSLEALFTLLAQSQTGGHHDHEVRPAERR